MLFSILASSMIYFCFSETKKKKKRKKKVFSRTKLDEIRKNVNFGEKKEEKCNYLNNHIKKEHNNDSSSEVKDENIVIVNNDLPEEVKEDSLLESIKHDTVLTCKYFHMYIYKVFIHFWLLPL